jgi:hypothetical protein
LEERDIDHSRMVERREIEAKGREVADALAALRALTGKKV